VLAVTLLHASGIAGGTPDLLITGARKAAPELSLKDANGRAINLSDHKGTVVLLDFWATWCTGCKLEIPWFMEFATKYRSKGLTAIGAAVDDEGWQTIKPYLAQHPISYPIVLGDMDVVQKTFGLPASLPVTLLIDRRGRIATTHPGVVDKNAFEKDIQRLLGEPGDKR
jgi:cytochrome c biogenesis protein CcmG/thiol:disulfide interchange protein DsbE